MEIYTLKQLKDRLAKFNYQWLPFQLIGIRSKEDKINEFDDHLYLVDGDKLFIFTGTTNPGVYWHQNFDNKKGVAVLKPGQYIDCWQLGKHRGIYTAWTQAKPVTVCRDNDKDNKSECNGVEEKGLFGINIHRSSENAISKWIDKWSAGCQVFSNGAQYKAFIEISQQKVKQGTKFFSYTLLEQF